MTNFSTIIICIFVSFGGFLFGYDTGLISGILGMEFFKRDFGEPKADASGTWEIKAMHASLIVSILSVGTFFGALLAGQTADRLGRKWSIIGACAVFAVGIVLQVIATSLGLMVGGRLIAGLGVGLLSDLIPLYQSEASPKHLRGTLVSTYQLAITIGLLVAFGVNMGTEGMNSRASFRIPIALQFAWAGILAFGMLTLPDSPRHLLHKGKRAQAERALARLRGVKDVKDPLVQEEMEEIQANLEFEAKLGGVGYADLFRGGALKRLNIGIWLQMFQQLTGVNFVFYYGTTFFQQAGISQNYIVQTITGVVNVVSTVPGLYLIER
ncbi:High-affinity glucose transporter rgt2, partial [Borealophlyctis nickersoniae]